MESPIECQTCRACALPEPAIGRDHSRPRVALVTGASRGLGRSTVMARARDGVDILLTYRSNEAEAQVAVQDIKALGRHASALRLDVGDSASFAGFAQRVRTALDTTWQQERFDYLVNNAGVGLPGGFH